MPAYGHALRLPPPHRPAPWAANVGAARCDYAARRRDSPMSTQCTNMPPCSGAQGFVTQRRRRGHGQAVPALHGFPSRTLQYEEHNVKRFVTMSPFVATLVIAAALLQEVAVAASQSVTLNPGD